MGLRDRTGGVIGLNLGAAEEPFSGVTIDSKPIDIVGYMRGQQEQSVPKSGKKKSSVGTINQNLDAAGEAASMSPGTLTSDVGVIPKIVGKKSMDSETAQTLEKNQLSYNNAQMILAGAQFFVNVLNADSAYRAVEGTAALNIAQARNNAHDAIFRGHQAAADRESEGYNAGQDATLAMAAQGQDVHSAGVQKIQGSYEAMGAFNGMREETNAIREALGYELEEVSYDYQVEQAGINRDMTIIGSALNLGAAGLAYKG